MVFITTLVLAVVLFINYYVFDGDVTSPPFLFVLTFIVSMTDLAINLPIWHTTINTEPLFIVLFGGIIFSITSIIIHVYFGRKNKNRIENIEDKEPPYIYVANWKLILFLLFQIIVIVFVQYYVKKLTSPYGTDGSLSSSISMYQYLTKFTTLDLDFPKWLTYTYIISNSSDFVWGYILIYDFFFFKKINPLLVINLLVSAAGSFLTGSRGVAVQMIMSLIVIYIMFYRDSGKEINWIKVLKKPFLILLVLLLSFRYLAKLLGRDHSLSIFEYISVYLGAPIKNFESFLNTNFNSTQPAWGYNTFSMQWQWLSEKFNLGIPKNTINVDMQYLNGHNLGNVFTAYKNYILDFGVLGAFICIIVAAIIMGFMYEDTKGFKEFRMTRVFSFDWQKMCYTYLLISLSFTFFSNKFYETFTVTFLQRIICWILLGYIFCKPKLRGKQIV